MTARDRSRSSRSGNDDSVIFSLPSYTTHITTASCSSSLSSASYYPSSCSSLSPPRASYHRRPLNTASPSSRRQHIIHEQHEHNSAREHLASLIRKHGPPTPVSSSSSLRKLTSTSPINASFLSPSEFVETPPASPAPVEEQYASTAGSRPIPIPRANSNRSVEDLPLTPLTGRFDHQYLAERPKHSQFSSTLNYPSDKSSRKKKKKQPRPTSSLVSSSSASVPATSRSHRSSRTKDHMSQSPSLAMPHSSGTVSPKPSSRDTPMHLGNLPRFHPAAYQSPNSTPNASLSPNTSNHHPRSFGYRVASGGNGSSRDALRQYRELVAASLSPPRSGLDGHDSEISAPRLDPLGSPGPVTPLTLEEAESYLAARPDHNSTRQADERDRHGTSRTKENKGR